MSLNKVLLIGNVGRDPEIRNLSNNSIVARFPLATSEKFKLRSGELQEQTEWHNIVCWRSLAELAEKYIKKGSRLYIEGKIRTSSWVDKNTNEKKYSTEILADNIIMLDRIGDRGAQARESEKNSERLSETPKIEDPTNFDVSDDDDLPF
jgi:single stranded DNA-binding protein (ssb)